MSGIKSVLATFLGVSLVMMISTQLPGQVLTPAPPLEMLPEVSNLEIGASTVLAASGTFNLDAGDMRRVLGRVEITSSTSGNVYIETYTQCIGPDGPVSQQGGAAENHQGNDTPVGPNYPSQGHLVLQPLLLLTAPKPGMYMCQLTATKGTSADPAAGVHMTALARVNDNPATWLEVSTANDLGASWWQNPPCDKDGNTSPTPADGPSACQYLAGASNLQQINVFDDDGSLNVFDGGPANVWEAASNAAFVDASASLMLTSCFYGTSSCLSDDSQSFSSHYFWDVGVDGGTVDTHLELIQLNPDGGTCTVNQTPEERWFVGNAAHHNMHNYSLSKVPVYPCNGSRAFKMLISVKYVTGVPLKEDGYLFTHGFVINSAYGTALPVPNVVGLQEGAAINSITTAGYVLSTVSYALNPAPQGTVIFQYPGAGNIENPGSGVELSLSSGGAFVPNLLGDPRSSATSAITALGLTPAVGYSHACINPGDVLLQSPPAGTLLAFGSTVTVTIDSGTFKNCGVIK
jgi:hypothetical protein